jgi:hypothetical protein
MTEYEKSLRNKYDAATKSLGPSGSEQNFKIAYQNLVKAGFAMQLKRKYRGGK